MLKFVFPEFRRFSFVSDAAKTNYVQRLLTPEERLTLQKHAATFEENLDPDEVIIHMFSQNVIGHRKKAELEAEVVSYKKSSMIFDYIFTSSYDKVMKFRDILNDTNQTHLAELITI